MPADLDYLRRYRDNLLAAGALSQQPGEHDTYAITVTAYRSDEPWPIGQWIGGRLVTDDRFADLLTPLGRGELDLMGIHVVAFDEEAPQVFTPRDGIPDDGVYDRLQDLLDVIDAHWRRIQPTATTSN